ncbi:hypothetical protein M9458_012358, partial [Cirrhinus mrigala]
LYHQTSSESSESNESSSSEEVPELRTTLKPVELNTLGPETRGDNPPQTNNATTQPSLAQTTPVPFLIGQEVVEFDLNISFVPLEPVVPTSPPQNYDVTHHNLPEEITFN